MFIYISILILICNLCEGSVFKYELYYLLVSMMISVYLQVNYSVTGGEIIPSLFCVFILTASVEVGSCLSITIMRSTF